MLAIPLIGRARELVVVQSALRRSVAGEGGVIVIRGDPGIGKSALVAAALDPATGEFTPLIGYAVPEASRPARALSELVVEAIGAGVDLDHPSLALFRRPLTALISAAPTDLGSLMDSAMMGPYAAAAGEGLLRLAGLVPGRAVLVVEDLHWADPETLNAVEFVATHLHGRGIALLVTLRSSESPTADAAAVRIGRTARSTTIDLGPLSADEVGAMASARLGAEAPPRLAADLQTFAEGVPLFVDEFLSATIADGSLAAVKGGWHYEPGIQPRPPESLSESIELRLTRLGPAAKEVLLAGALLGRMFDIALVTRSLNLDPTAVAGSLRVAIRYRLVRISTTPDHVEFPHALIRDAVDAMLVPPHRAIVARSILAALPTTGGAPANSVIETAGVLAREAGERDLAASYFLQAGRAAVLRGAVGSAHSPVAQALALADDPDLLVAAQLASVDAHAFTGDAARALVEGASVLRHVDGESESALQLHLSMARAAAAGQLWPVAQSHLDAALAIAGDATAAELALQGVVALGAGRLADSVDLATRAAARAEADGNPAVACESYEVLGRAARTRDLDEAMAWFDRAVGVAERHGLMLWRARALHELATIGQLRDLRVDDLYRARQAAVDAGAAGLLSAVEFHIAAIHGVRFEPDPALEASRRCLDEARRLGVVRQQAWAWILIGQAHACAGHRLQASAAADEALRLAPGDPEIAGLAEGTCRGLGSLLANDLDRAVDQFRRGVAHLRPLPRVPLPTWYLWPLIALEWTDDDEGTRALAEADHPALRVAAGSDGLWQLAAAVAAGRGGDHDGAEAWLGRAERTLRGLPGFAGYRHIGMRIAAEAAIRDGWGSPGDWLSEAETWSTAMGFDVFAATCRALQRRAGVRQRRRGRGATPVSAELAALGVTTREADVLTLVAAGLTNPQIAGRLYISPRTVKSHVESLLRKTSSTGRTQLATLAAGAGLTGMAGRDT